MAQGRYGAIEVLKSSGPVVHKEIQDKVRKIMSDKELLVSAVTTDGVVGTLGSGVSIIGDIDSDSDSVTVMGTADGGFDDSM